MSELSEVMLDLGNNLLERHFGILFRWLNSKF